MKHFFIDAKFQLSALFVFCALLITSCKKDCPPISGPVVLVAGYESIGETDFAKYWANGTEIVLSDGTNDAQANSIFSAGNNVYIAGTDGGAVYWKNNVRISLPSSFPGSAANTIFISGSNVYVAGFDGGAVYWKNGVEVRLSSGGGPFDHEANSIFVAGSDVYVAGSDGKDAVYWKNGIKTTVVAGPPVGGAISTSIYIVGSDVYVGAMIFAGGLTNTLCYKNGVIVLNKLGWSTQVFVSGGNVYVSGEVYVAFTPGNAIYWKDGTEVDLTTDPLSSTFIELARANSIYVTGTNVYTAGFHYNGTTNTAVYWKNGAEMPLTNGTNNAKATSIFVR